MKIQSILLAIFDVIRWEEPPSAITRTNQSKLLVVKDK